MNKILFLTLLLICVFKSFSQSQGISYQAIILDPSSQNNILPNNNIILQFTIINDFGVEEYKETHNATTDKYGMVNLVVGSGNSLINKDFSSIIWDGVSKKLKIEIDFDSSNNFIQLSEQNLYYMPQPPNKQTKQEILDNYKAILEEAKRAKDIEESSLNNITVIKEENIKQNEAIVLNSSKISYPGDQDISGISINAAILSSFKFYYPDKDGDGFGDKWSLVYSPIAPEGYVENNTDCNDSLITGASIFPGAVEIPNDGIDQDCDGYDLVTWFMDSDGDGYGNPNATILANLKPTGYVKNNTDCNDTPITGVTIHPGANEIPNDGIDQNCDGVK